MSNSNLTLEKDCNDVRELEPELPTLKVGNLVYRKNQHVVGQIVSIEGDATSNSVGVRAWVGFDGGEPKSIPLSDLLLASDISSENDIPDEADYSDYEDVDRAEAVIQEPQALEAHNFDYSTVDDKSRLQVIELTSLIKTLIRNNTQNILGIGEKLTQVQELLRHDKKGGFRTWLEAEFGWNYRTGYNFIRVWEKFGNCENFSQLDIAISALYLLAALSTPESALKCALDLAKSGVRITHKKAKELIAKYRPPKPKGKRKKPFGKDVKDDFLKAGDMIELLNPPSESGWSPGDIAIIGSVSYETRTVLLELDPHQIGRLFRSFSFDDIRKFDHRSQRMRDAMPTPPVPTSPVPTPNTEQNYSCLGDDDLTAAFVAYKQGIKSYKAGLSAIKLELARRHNSKTASSTTSSTTAGGAQ